MQEKAPHNSASEKAIIGTILSRSNSAIDILAKFNPEHFYIKEHKIIARVIKELMEENAHPDIINVHSKLRDVDENIDFSIPKLHQYIQMGSMMQIVPEYLKEIEVLWKERNLRDACQRVCSSGDHVGFERLLTVLKENLEKIDGMNTEGGLAESNQLLNAKIAKLLHRAQHGDTETLSTSFLSLDSLVAGYKPGRVTVVGARPAMGKTAFALNTAWNASVLQEKVVAYFCLEMTGDDLMTRIISNGLKIDSKRIDQNKLDVEELADLFRNSTKLRNNFMYFDDESHRTYSEILSECRRLKRKRKGLDLVVVDYLQLIKVSSKKNGTRELEVAEISRSLKIMAMELNCHVLLLCQLNRNLENRECKRPFLADIRESGSVEQDADVVMFLYRDEVYNKESIDNGLCEVIVSKNRHGETGTVKLVFQPQYSKFSEIIKL